MIFTNIEYYKKLFNNILFLPKDSSFINIKIIFKDVRGMWIYFLFVRILVYLNNNTIIKFNWNISKNKFFNALWI